MKMKAVQFVGAKREAYIPAYIPVEIRIVDHPRTRSFQRFTNQTKTTYHDTGNPRTRAWGEYNWLAGGRQGGVVGGYQFIFDDSVLIQTGPLNEVSWHAGTPIGNQSFGAEHAYGGGTDWAASLEIGCALHGSLIEMQGLDPDDAAVMHQFWTGKYCSAQILNRGQWPYVKSKIKAYTRMSAQARAQGGGPVDVDPAPAYALPAPVIIDGKKWDGSQSGQMNDVKFVADKRTVTVNVRALNARQYAGTASALTGPARQQGDKINVLGWAGGELVDDEPRWWIAEDYSRYWVGGTAEEPREWTDHSGDEELQPGVRLVNGRAYYPFVDDDGKLGRKMFVTGPANLRKWAGTGSEIVGSKREGEEITVLYWTVGEQVADEKIWFVIDGGEADPLFSGGRIWAGLTTDRPK